MFQALSRSQRPASQQPHNQSQLLRQRSSNLSVNRSSEVVHVHQAKVHEVADTGDFRGPLCMDCVHSSLQRSRHSRPRHHIAQHTNRHILRLDCFSYVTLAQVNRNRFSNFKLK